MKTYTNEPPCITFSRIDVTDPIQVAEFADYLYDTNPPFEEMAPPPRERNESFADIMDRVAADEDGFYKRRNEKWKEAFQADRELNPWKCIEDEWGFNAPRRRMLKLLLLRLGQYDVEQFENRFTLDLDCLADDAKDCAIILPDIQDKFKWVLEGFKQRQDHENSKRWSASAGEYWWLPPEQAEFVRGQLLRTRFELIEQLSIQYADLYATIDRYKMACENVEHERELWEFLSQGKKSKIISREGLEHAESLAKKYHSSALEAEKELALYGLDDEKKYALSQRFDVVPQDFEASLYVDFAQFIRSGGNVQPCAFCGLAMPVNARQQARARKGLPVYHEDCHQKQRAVSKSLAYQAKSKEPDFREKENSRVRAYRSEVQSSKLKGRAK